MLNKTEDSNTSTLFTQQAKQYAASRPAYPNALYNFIKTLVPEHEHVIDAATGNGQAAVQLAEHFERVTAFDISAPQLSHAKAHPRVSYHHASSDSIPAPDHSADLITAATGAHWFDLPAFYADVRRVSKPHGVVCLWSYGSSSLDSPEINALAAHVASDIVGEYWSRANLDYVATQYKSLPFPFKEIATPPFTATQDVTMDHFLGFLRSWSATQRFVDARGYDPIERIRPQFLEVWGDPQHHRRWQMPIFMRAGYVHANDGASS